MKTLIFNGSPRKNGDTVSLLKILTQELEGETMQVNAYSCGISPCVDCRFCWKQKGCRIDDKMQEVYEYLKDCDNVLIASPVHFSELTGCLLGVLSRLQACYCARIFCGEEMIPKEKRGAVLLVGGGDGTPDRACHTARTLLHQMRCVEIYPLVCSHGTNERPAAADEEALCGVRGITAFFNRENEFIIHRQEK